MTYRLTWLVLLAACGTDVVDPPDTNPDADRPGTWSATAPLPDARHSFGIATFRNRVYLLGGAVDATLNGVPSATGRVSSDVFRQDPATGAWEQLNPLPYGGWMNAAVAVVGDSLYVAGGYWTSGFDPPRYSDTLWVYQPDTDTWAARAALPGPRHQAAATEWNGRLALIGGLDDTATLLAGGLLYDPATDQWDSLPPPRRPRTNATALVHGGDLFLVSGNHEIRTTDGYPEVERLDATSLTWSDVTLVPLTVAEAAAAVVDGSIHVIGGRGLDNRTKDLHQVFNLAEGTWTEHKELPVSTGLYGHRALVRGGSLYVAGGRAAIASSTAAVLRFDPPPPGPVLR